MIYVIYFIYHDSLLLYVGSTKDFKERKRTHKYNCYSEKRTSCNCKIYQYIRDNNINFDDLEWKVEETEIIDKTEAFKLEGSKIIEMKPLCNQLIAGRTKKEYSKEYRQTNKRKQYDKERNKTNKYKEYNKQYYQKQKLFKNWLDDFISI